MPRTVRGLPGVYNATPLTLDDGEGAALALNASGELVINLETADIEIGAVEIKNSTDDTRATVGADGLYVDVRALTTLPAGTNLIGYVAKSRRADAFQATITSGDASSATQVKAKTAAKNIYITDLIISVDTAMNVQLQDDAVSPEVLMEQIYLPAVSVFSKIFETPIKVATNQDLDVITSASGNISVTVTGYVV